MMDFLIKHKLINPSQHGFLKAKSCLTNMLGMISICAVRCIPCLMIIVLPGPPYLVTICNGDVMECFPLKTKKMLFNKCGSKCTIFSAGHISQTLNVDFLKTQIK